MYKRQLSFLTFLSVSVITSALTTKTRQLDKLRMENEKIRMRACLLYTSPGSGGLDKCPDGLFAVSAPQRYGLTVMFQDLPHHAGHPRTPLKQNSPEAA